MTDDLLGRQKQDGFTNNNIHINPLRRGLWVTTHEMIIGTFSHVDIVILLSSCQCVEARRANKGY
jgi:hypothetical protein